MTQVHQFLLQFMYLVPNCDHTVNRRKWYALLGADVGFNAFSYREMNHLAVSFTHTHSDTSECSPAHKEILFLISSTNYT